MPESRDSDRPEMLMTPERRKAFAELALMAYGDYLRLADPDTYRFYVTIAETGEVSLGEQ